MSTSSNKPASSMAELMARHGKDIHTLKKSEKVTGTITVLSMSDVMLRLDNGVDVQVIEKDRSLLKHLVATLHVGDKVDAVVLYPESDSGYPMVTLRHFMEGKVWEELSKLQQGGGKLEVTVTDSTKGGLLVEADNGIHGFLPNSHITTRQKPEDMVGQKLQVSVVEISKADKKVVFSQKESLTTEDFTNLAKQYKAGEKVQGTISGITSFGMFVSLPYKKANGQEVPVDGLVHISEVAWEKVEDLSQLFQMGDNVEAVVIGIDPRSKRIDLSIKRLTSDPFQKIANAFPVDKKVSGTVGDMTEQGLLVDLGEVEGVVVEGLMKKDKIPAGTTYEKGKSITATVVSVDPKKRKVFLTPVLLEKPLMYR